MVYFINSFFEGDIFKKGDIFKRVVISRAYGDLCSQKSFQTLWKIKSGYHLEEFGIATHLIDSYNPSKPHSNSPVQCRKLEKNIVIYIDII